MDSLRALHCSVSSSPVKFRPKRFQFLNPSISLPFRNLGLDRRRSRKSVPRIICGVSSTETREEEKKMKKIKSKSGHGKVQLNVRLDHQVEFGEHVVILGSTKELGSWKKKMPMNWTEHGWVSDLELKGGESIEYKFVIVRKDKSLLWEGGDNRILKLPKGGSFSMVCQWNATGEAVNLLTLSSEESEEEVEYVGENGSAGAASVLEMETSSIVGQWQGKAASCMRANEHRNREIGRKWDTSGVQGIALNLVEGDRNARNWWRKV